MKIKSTHSCFDRHSAKVSVIIPVYNVEKYLEKCIESLILQSLKEIEIIIVDDGSTDNSGDRCDAFAKQDKRIIVIHESNKGLSCARNAGIDAASAPYIMFVDSDDYVEPDFCEQAYRMAIENDADLVLFSYNRLQQNGKSLKPAAEFKTGLLNEAEAMRFNITFAPAIWLGQYHKNLFRDIRFPAGKLFEDTGTTHRLLHAAHKIFFLDRRLYNYRSGRQGSIISSSKTKEHPDRREMKFRRINDLCSWGYERLIWNDALYLLIRYGRKGNEQSSLVDIANKIKGYPAECNFKRKALLAMFKWSPILFDAVCLFMMRRRRIN